jgi:hypothetical protein
VIWGGTHKVVFVKLVVLVGKESQCTLLSIYIYIFFVYYLSNVIIFCNICPESKARKVERI